MANEINKGKSLLGLNIGPDGRVSFEDNFRKAVEDKMAEAYAERNSQATGKQPGDNFEYVKTTDNGQQTTDDKLTPEWQKERNSLTTNPSPVGEGKQNDDAGGSVADLPYEKVKDNTRRKPEFITPDKPAEDRKYIDRTSTNERLNQMVPWRENDKVNVMVSRILEHDKEKDADRLSGNVTDAAINVADSIAEKIAEAGISERMDIAANPYYATDPSAMSGAMTESAVRTSNDYWKQLTPEAVGNHIEEALKQIPHKEVFDAAYKAGVSTDWYIANVLAPKIQQGIYNKLLERQVPKNTLEYVQSGVFNSIIGQVAEILYMPAEVRQMRAQGRQIAGEREGTVAEMGNMAVGFLADAPIFKGIGGLVGKLKYAGPNKALGMAIEFAKGGANFGGYNAVSTLTGAAHQKGEIAGEDVLEAGKAFGRGMVTGTAMGAVGALGQTGIAKWSQRNGIGLGTRIGTKAAHLASNTATMAVSDMLLSPDTDVTSGRDWADQFKHSLMMNLIMDTQHAIESAIRKPAIPYKQRGVDIQAMKDAGLPVRSEKELYRWLTQPGQTRNRLENDILSNPKLSLEEKNKALQLVAGDKASLQLRPTVDAVVTRTMDGRWVVKESDALETVNRRRVFATKEEAEVYRESLQPEIMRNQTDYVEQMDNARNETVAMQEGIKVVAQESGKEVSKIKAIIRKNGDGEKLTKEEEALRDHVFSYRDAYRDYATTTREEALEAVEVANGMEAGSMEAVLQMDYKNLNDAERKAVQDYNRIMRERLSGKGQAEGVTGAREDLFTPSMREESVEKGKKLYQAQPEERKAQRLRAEVARERLDGEFGQGFADLLDREGLRAVEDLNEKGYELTRKQEELITDYLREQQVLDAMMEEMDAAHKVEIDVASQKVNDMSPARDEDGNAIIRIAGIDGKAYVVRNQVGDSMMLTPVELRPDGTIDWSTYDAGNVQSRNWKPGVQYQEVFGSDVMKQLIPEYMQEYNSVYGERAPETGMELSVPGENNQPIRLKLMGQDAAGNWVASSEAGEYTLADADVRSMIAQQEKAAVEAEGLEKSRQRQREFEEELRQQGYEIPEEKAPVNWSRDGYKINEEGKEERAGVQETADKMLEDAEGDSGIALQAVRNKQTKLRTEMEKLRKEHEGETETSKLLEQKKQYEALNDELEHWNRVEAYYAYKKEAEKEPPLITRERVQLMQRFADKIGSKLVISDNMYATMLRLYWQTGNTDYLPRDRADANLVNGINANGVIYINGESIRGLLWAFGHESGHSVAAASKKAYTAFKDAVRTTMGAEAWEEAKKAKRKVDVYSKKLEDDIEEEVVNDQIGEIFNDPNKFDTFAKLLIDGRKKTAIKALWNAAKKFASNISMEGLKDVTADLKKEWETVTYNFEGAEKKLAEAYGILEKPAGGTSGKTALEAKHSVRWSIEPDEALEIGKGSEWRWKELRKGQLNDRNIAQFLYGMSTKFPKLMHHDAYNPITNQRNAARRAEEITENHAYRDQLVDMYSSDVTTPKAKQLIKSKIIEYDYAKNYYEKLASGELKGTDTWTEDSPKFSREADDKRAPIFYSNAQRAVEGIRQEKATPEQWLAMITKLGGIKAGEDKWMGLSEWLKSKDKKSLTREEVMKYIQENQIQIEEQRYEEMPVLENNPILQAYRQEFNAIAEELSAEREKAYKNSEEFEEKMYEKYGYDWFTKITDEENKTWNELVNKFNSIDNTDAGVFDEMVNRHGDDFRMAFHVEGGELEPEIDYPYGVNDAARTLLNIQEKQINETRLEYTTEGLDNKKEIALVVPTIESWRESDEIHFGDAGDGRAIAWARFGETNTLEDYEKDVPKSIEYIGELPKSKAKKDAIEDIIANFDFSNYVVARDEQFVRAKAMAENSLNDNMPYVDSNQKEHYQNILKELKELKPSDFKIVYDKGERVLVIDEIQSKRHQEGREKGYYDNAETVRLYQIFYALQKRRHDITERQKAIFDEIASSEEVKPLLDQDGTIKLEAREKYNEIIANNSELKELEAEWIDVNSKVQEAHKNWEKAYDKIPDAPFDKNWHELAMKRMLRYAAENGYDKLAWTTGAQQAERYNIGKVIDLVERTQTFGDTGETRFDLQPRNNSGSISLFVKDGMVTRSSMEEFEGKPLVDVVGKELAAKMLEMKDYSSMNIADMQIGAEGMAGFYDKMLPSFMNKYGKKWGVKVGEVELPNLEKSAQKMWAVDITPEMKESVLMDGQPMFSKEIGRELLPAKDGVMAEIGGPITRAEIVRALDSKSIKNWVNHKDDVGTNRLTTNLAGFNTIARDMAKARLGVRNKYDFDGNLFYNPAEELEFIIAEAKKKGLPADISYKYDFGNGEQISELLNEGKPLYTEQEVKEIKDRLPAGAHKTLDNVLQAFADNKRINEEQERILSYDDGNAFTKALVIFDIASKRLREKYESDDRYFHTTKDYIDAEGNIRNGGRNYQLREGEKWANRRAINTEVADEILRQIATSPITNDALSKTALTDGRFSKEGEKGVRRLVEAGMDEDNLAIAKEMREAGKDALTIKMATGWEYGHDGKWKKEDEDLHFQDDWFKKNGEKLRLGSELYRLSDVIDDSRLFTAYPDLKDVFFETNIGYGKSSGYDPSLDRITLGAKQFDNFGEPFNEKEVRDIAEKALAHEVQHWIQYEEGFARGGNPRNLVYGVLKDNMTPEERAAWDAARKKQSDSRHALENLREQGESLREMSYDKSGYKTIAEFMDSKEPLWQPAIRMMKDLQAEYDRTLNEGNDAGNEVERIQSEVAKRLKLPYGGYLDEIGYDGYRRLAGETEARAVGERTNLTADERLLTLTEVDEDVPASEQIVYFSKETDPETLKKLDSEETVKVYRAIRVNEDGTLSSPMAGGGVGGKRKGERVDTYQPKFGEWEKADEHPELAAMKDGEEYGHVTIDKGEGNGTLEVAYNPYIHTSRQMLNDQFSSAWRRPNLQVMEVEVPVSELTSGYRADMAKNAVGETEWTDGVVARQLEGDKKRKVILSRWDKPVRIVPAEEYAKAVKEQLDGSKVEGIPFNCVTPEQREALVKEGVKILEPEKKAGAEAMKAYKDWEASRGKFSKEIDGRQMVMQSLFDEVDGKTKKEELSDMRLRPLEEGETCHVQRVYEEAKQFSFVGKEKVESMDDVAYIFKKLEDAAVENAFMVMVKDGKPTVLHVGMGHYTGSSVEHMHAIAAWQRIKPDAIYVVHNHPSGILRASTEDRRMLLKMMEIFGADVVKDGIIIDTTSGQYGVFTEGSRENINDMPDKPEYEVPIKTYSFTKQVFEPGWNPNGLKISDTKDAAIFISSHRLGKHKKMNLLVLNNQLRVTGNIFLPYTKLSELLGPKKSDYKKAALELSSYINTMGGMNCILHGNYDFDESEKGRIEKLAIGLKNIGHKLLDVVHVSSFVNYESASEKGWISEPEVKFNQNSKAVQGLDGYTEQDVLDIVRGDIREIFEDAGIDAKIKGMALNGSRMRGDARKDSDLDVVVEYEGNYKEDALFNLLNEQPIMIEGVKVDINPITKYKSGTLEEYMERSRKYDEEVKGKTQRPLISDGNPVVKAESDETLVQTHDGGIGVQFSKETYEKRGRALLHEQLEKAVERGYMVEREAQEIRDRMELIYQSISEVADMKNEAGDLLFPLFADIQQMDVKVNADGQYYLSAIMPNHEYPMNIDFSKSCVKREAMNTVLNALLTDSRFDATKMTNKDYFRVKELCKKYGLEIPCYGCYVEASRGRTAEWANKVADDWNKLVDLYNTYGKEAIKKAAKMGAGSGTNGSDKKWFENTMRYILVNMPRNAVKIESADLISPERSANLLSEHPDVYMAIKKHSAQGTPSLVVPDAIYNGEILAPINEEDNWGIDKAYEIGGVRLQSASDFKPKLFFDYSQVLADIASKKLPAHTYTKVPSYAMLFGKTGMKINLSLFPKAVKGVDPKYAGLDANGGYAWSGESFPVEEAFRIQDMEGYDGNVGTMAVGISDAHIWKLLDDARIKSVIPYHSSHLGAFEAERTGMDAATDYTFRQSDQLPKKLRNDGEGWPEYYKRISRSGETTKSQYGKKLDEHSEWRPDWYEYLRKTKDPIAAGKMFVEECQAHGVIPRFPEFVYREDGSFNENYYKLIQDYTTYDKDGNYVRQRAVTLDMPDNWREVLTDALTKEEKSLVGIGNKLPQIVEEFLNPESNVKFSKDDKGKDANSTLLQVSEDTQAVQRNKHLSGTKVEINSENRKEIEENLSSLAKIVKNEQLQSEDFLLKLRKSMKTDSDDHSGYSTQEINGEMLTLRISDHHSNAKHNKQNGEFKVVSVVIKTPYSKNRFRKHKDVELIEYTFNAATLTQKNEQDIVTGIKQWVETGQCNIDGAIKVRRSPVDEMPKIEAPTKPKGNENFLDYASRVMAEERSGVDSKPTEADKGIKYSKEDTSTESFKRWFGDWEKDPENASKVVDADGRPLVVYHDTNSTVWRNKKTGEIFDDLDWKDRDYWQNEATQEEWDNTWEEQDFYVFDNKNHGRQSVEVPGFFFSPTEDKYHAYGKRRIAAYLNIKNPIVDPDIPNRGVTDTAGRDAMEEWIKQGYDGMIRTDGNGNVEEYVAFYPNQIKSATENNGDYDPNNPDIRYSKEGKSAEWKKAKEELKDYPFALETLRSLEVQDINDVAASVLAGGNLLWGDKGEGPNRKKGVQSMMGWKEGERKNFLSMFAKDGMTFAQAGEAVEQACREEHIPFDENDPNAGVNALQEVLGSVKSMGELTNYVELRRVDEARAAVQDAQNHQAEERNEYYLRNYGMSYDDYMTYQEESAKAQAGKGISEEAQRDINWLRTKNERQAQELQRIQKELERLHNEELARPLVITQGKIIEQQKAQLDQTKTELNQLKDATRRKKNYEDAYRQLLEVKRDVANFVREQLAAEDMPFTSKKDLNKLLATIEKTNTVEQLQDALREVQIVAGRGRVKHLDYELSKLLRLQIQGLNGKRMSVAKTVDDRTRRIIEDIRGRVQDIGISGMEEELDGLMRQRREQRGAINELRNKLKEAEAEEKVTLQAKIDEGEKRWQELSEQIQTKADEISEARESKRSKSVEDLTEEINAIIEQADLLAQDGKQLPEAEADKLTALEGFKILQQSKKSANDVYKLEKGIRDLWSEIYELRAEREGKDDKECQRLNKLIINRKEKIKANEALLADAINQQAFDIQEGINMLETLMDEGRNSLKQKTDAALLRRCEMIKNACADVRNKKNQVDFNRGSNPDIKKNPTWKSFINAPVGSFEYMAQRLGQTGKAGKDSWIYQHFVMGKEGVMEAFNTYQRGMREQKDQLNDKVTEIFGTKNNKWVHTDAWVRQAEKADKIVYDSGVTIRTEDGRREVLPLSKGAATYLYMVWKMEDGKSKMMLQGFDNTSMQEIRGFIGKDYMQLADWLQDTFLVGTRAKYNERYRELYNTSMARIENYVPLRVNKDVTRQESDLSEDKNRRVTLEQRAGSLINRTVNNLPVDITKSVFDVISEHVEQMENWYAYSPVRRDLDAILSNTFFRNQVDANNAGHFKRFYDAAAIATQSYVAPPAEHGDALMAAMTKGLLGGNIAWRAATAIKQLYSASAYLGYTYDPMFVPYLMKNTATGMLGINFQWCMDNIPSFRARVDMGDIGNVRISERVGDLSGNWAKKLNKYLQNYTAVGMIPNRLIDALTCSIGAKSIYDYKIRQLRLEIEKDKTLTNEQRQEALKEAHRKAVMEADIFYNSTQQSSNPMFLSPMQVSRTLLDRSMTAYQNNNLGYVRKTLEAAYDLIQSAQYQKMKKAYKDSYIEDGIAEDEADTMARRQVLKTIGNGLLGVFVMAWLNKDLWDKGSTGFFGFWADPIDETNEQQENESDDDYKNRMEWQSFYSWIGLPARPLQGTPMGNYLKSVSEKRSWNPLLVFNELENLQKDFEHIMKNDGVFSKELLWAVTNHAMRTGGINLETLGNIYYGMEQMAIDGGDVNEKMIDLMFLLNNPNKGRVDAAKNLYKDEDFITYAQDVAKADKYLTKGTAIAHFFPWMKEFNGDDANGKELRREYDKLKKEWEAYNDIGFAKPAGVGAETTKIYNEQVKWDDIVEDGQIANILREAEGVNREWNRLKKEDKESDFASSAADDYLELNGKAIAQYKLINKYKQKFGALKRKLNGTTQDETIMDDIRELRTKFLKNIKDEKFLQNYVEEELE